MSEQTATVDGLPELPEPGMQEINPYLDLGPLDPHKGVHLLHWFTAVQMREYARAALAASAAVQAVPQQPVAWRARGYGQYKTGQPGPWGYKTGAECPKYNNPECCDIEPLYASPVQAVPTWQPISTAPKDGTQILAWCQHKNDPYNRADKFAAVCWYADPPREPGCWEGQPTYWHQPTHWIPLPAAPGAPTEPVQRPGDHLSGGAE